MFKTGVSLAKGTVISSYSSAVLRKIDKKKDY